VAPVLVVFLPAGAQAHMTVPGMNNFVGGALHPLTVPAHVLILLGLGLGLGQHLPLRLGLAMRSFVPASALGLALTMTDWMAGVHPGILAGLALTAGVLVAWEKELPPPAQGVLLAAGALAIGLDSGQTGGTWAVVSTLLGTWLALLIYLLNIAHYVSLAAERRRQWLRIGIRVAGSWIAAISLLVLAFALRK
jgi:hydrogenase/urease accessory protein HupE